ncbi:Hypothetical protein KLENKIAIHU_2512, partial [Klenkia terrae]
VDVPAVVRRHRTALLGTAFLLTGDERSAEERVDRALARLSPADDHAAAVRALLRTRPGRGRITEAGPDPWWVSPAELTAARRTAAVLAGLAPADRTALVRAHEDLPADPDRLARARAALPDPSAALAGLLAVRRPPVRDDAAAVPVVAAHRRARWARPALAVAVLAVVAVLATQLPRTAPTPAAAAAAGRFDGPARGSLADDTAFLAAARDAPWAGRAAPADRRVVLAGDLLDRRVVLVVGDTADGLVGQWSTAATGAPAADLEPANQPVALRADRPAALLLDTALVVVADPDEGVRVSAGQVVGPSGAVQRVYRAQPVDDGVAALQLAAPDPGGLAVRVQVARTGEVSPVALADVPVTRAGSAGATAPAAVGPPLRGSPADGGARQAAADAALGAVTAPTGLDPAALAPVLVWAGPLPRPVGGEVDAVVLAVPLPGGALVVSTAWADRLADGTLQQVGCGSRAFPAGTDPAAVVLAARCVVADRESGTSQVTVLLTGPGGTTTTPDDGRRLDVLPVDGAPVPVTRTGPGDLFDE